MKTGVVVVDSAGAAGNSCSMVADMLAVTMAVGSADTVPDAYLCQRTTERCYKCSCNVCHWADGTVCSTATAMIPVRYCSPSLSSSVCYPILEMARTAEAADAAGRCANRRSGVLCAT